MDDLQYALIESAVDVPAVASRVLAAKELGLDIETFDPVKGGGSLDPRTGKIRLIQLNVDDEPDGLFVVDLMKTDGAPELIEALRGTKALVIAHNAKFEQQWFKFLHDIEFWPVFCTYRAAALLNNGLDHLKNGLWDLYQRELGITISMPDESGSDWSTPELSESQIRYAVEDVRQLLRLRRILKQKLTDAGLLLTALIEFGVLLPEGCMEMTGMYLDSAMWLALARENAAKAKTEEEDLLFRLPHPKGQLGLPGMAPSWNIGSTQQMRQSLSLLGIHVENTREETLKMEAPKHPIIRDIIQQRKLAKNTASFGEDYLAHINPITGRVHTSYFALLASGRYSSSNPNLQQIPRDPKFRACFRAAPGKRLVAADYAGIEMRIVAEISGDTEMIAVFVRGEDAHQTTASIIMDKPLDAVTKGERQVSKPVNFGLIYGMMPPKLVIYAMAGYGVVMSESEAKTYWNRFFQRYYGIKRWHDRVTRDGRASGVSRSIGGRIRYLDPALAWNEWKNNPVQSTGADALKLALAYIHKEISKHGDAMKMIHIVHDEIILEVDDNDECANEAKTILKVCMTKAMERFLKVVPVVVDPAEGYSWAEIH